MSDKKTGMEALRSELLDDVAAHTVEVLSDHGISSELAEQAAFALTEHLAENWGGQLINFPMNFFYKLAQRDMVIYNEFNGRNHAALAKRYGMSVRGIYKLIKRAKKRATTEVQHDMFD